MPSTSPRTTRAIATVFTMPTARMTGSSPEPMLAANSTATSTSGKPQMKSTTSEMTLSTTPLTYPAMRPMTVPSTIAIAVTEIATSRLMRMPNVARAARSRPRPSVPQKAPSVPTGLWPSRRSCSA